MPHRDFQHVTTWVFDLDNTLYPPGMRLFDQIEERMTEWVMNRLAVSRAHADHLRRHYWQLYGTTLAGLMNEHRIEPGEYLAAVHDIDFSPLLPDPALAAAIAALPGRRIVFTNADTVYARKVLEKRGFSGLFDAVYGVEHAGFHPKPGAEAYAAIRAQDGFDPATAAMFEDDPRNLAVPHALGMRTVHVAPRPHPAPHIDHHTDDLERFLRRLRG
ncbi:MAG: pyrimidine 5'-nucleotidase [Rhodobacteraceae bacterium]|jgi:putative hydrolase of the HAD superfamily|nr:pyrimidine 5'-nucleotidase [Paracoccaceae bacterium]